MRPIHVKGDLKGPKTVPGETVSGQLQLVGPEFHANVSTNKHFEASACGAFIELAS